MKPRDLLADEYVPAPAPPRQKRWRTKVEFEDTSPIGGTIFIGVIGLLFAVFLVWAYVTTIDEVTKGEGRVIPSSTTQIIQATEAGIVEEITVRLGQQVRRGDLLARLDPTTTTSNLGELEAQDRSLRTQIARLESEYRDGMAASFVCPAGVAAIAPELCANEASLLRARHENLQVRIQGLRERVIQRRSELKDAHTAVETFTESLRLGESELALKRPLAERNIIPRVEIIQLERQLSDLRGQLSSAQEAIPRIEAALREAELQVEEQNLVFRQEALAEMTAKLAQRSVVQETMRGAQDRVSRTSIRSPVDGIVNALHVNTLGAFVQAGGRMMDVVPLEDTLLIETRVRPSDIAFLRPDQKAMVKITAYDFSIYGGLEGQVVHISADSVLDEQTREPYYIVLVKTDQAYLEHAGKTHPIMPGMISEVDILTGEKSILDYLLKPINKARQNALRER
jgi:membrane fusion protein, adhesin transport system